MTRPRLVDLYAGAGGAGRGYQLAGFHVTGVDVVDQPNYGGDAFVRADALTFPLDGFDAVHASPPCQRYSIWRQCRPDRGDDQYVDLIEPTRQRLIDAGVPYVIENVVGAPLVDPILLCGSMFDPPLDVQRHRLFEANWALDAPMWPCRHRLWAPRFNRGSRATRPNDRRTVAVGEWRIPLAVQRRAMGIEWMTVAELSQAIPPAYTKHIGDQMIRTLEVAA